MRSKFKKVIQTIKAFVPRRLPETPAAHWAWATAIIEIGSLPDNDSFRHAIATQVLHLPPNVMRKSQMYFVSTLRRSIANQTAFQIVQETKGAQKNEKAV